MMQLRKISQHPYMFFLPEDITEEARFLCIVLSISLSVYVDQNK